MYQVFLTQSNHIILGPITKILGIVLNYIYEILAKFGIENSALAIVLFTFIVNALMIPLTVKQQKTSKLTSYMQPEINKVMNKYKGKKDEQSMRMQQLEIQAIYDKYGANPMASMGTLFISLPIMIGLYTIIYNIPAYVKSVYNLYEPIARSIQENHPGFMVQLVEYAKIASPKFSNKFITTISTGDVTINQVIDVLSRLRPSSWEELAGTFPQSMEIINTNSAEIIKMNQIFGSYNIADIPKIASITVLIPILAMLVQYIQTFQMEKTMGNVDNPSMQSMKTMTRVMPIMSGVFCLSLPIGVGLYWIAGGVFRIVQQAILNRYLEKIDFEKVIEQNKEKAEEKARKRQQMMNKLEEADSLRKVSNVNTKNINYDYSESKSDGKDNKSDNKSLKKYANKDLRDL